LRFNHLNTERGSMSVRRCQKATFDTQKSHFLPPKKPPEKITFLYDLAADSLQSATPASKRSSLRLVLTTSPEFTGSPETLSSLSSS